MAKWRAIHADISTSGQVNRLTEFEQLLFTWMIPHADDWGVLTGDLMELKLKVMPGTDRQSQELDAALAQIEKVGLIWRYEPDTEGPLIQFRKWDNHQPIRKDRRHDPEHTLYPAFCQLPTKAGQSQAETGHTILDNTILDKKRVAKKPRKRGNPESRKKLKHWAFEIWRGVFGKKVKGKPPNIEQRDAIIAFAESKGEEWWRKRLEYWKQHPWSPWNFKGMMETKWEPSHAKTKRSGPTPTIDYDKALKRQAETQLDA